MVENANTNIPDLYSSCKKVDFHSKTVYNEDDEEFEEIECPKEESSNMLTEYSKGEKLVKDDEETHFV